MHPLNHSILFIRRSLFLFLFAAWSKISSCRRAVSGLSSRFQLLPIFGCRRFQKTKEVYSAETILGACGQNEQSRCWSIWLRNVKVKHKLLIANPGNTYAFIRLTLKRHVLGIGLYTQEGQCIPYRHQDLHPRKLTGNLTLLRVTTSYSIFLHWTLISSSCRLVWRNRFATGVLQFNKKYSNDDVPWWSIHKHTWRCTPFHC